MFTFHELSLSKLFYFARNSSRPVSKISRDTRLGFDNRADGLTPTFHITFMNKTLLPNVIFNRSKSFFFLQNLIKINLR